MKKEKKILIALDRLQKIYPSAKCELDFENVFQLMVAVQLSAQCTDKRVNLVTPALFHRVFSWQDLARISEEELQRLIFSTGFYRQKSKNLISCAQKVLLDFGGELPQTMAELITLAGVARKTANVVLQSGFGKTEGIVVDTHVKRIARKLGLTRSQNPVRIERNLMDLLPRERWAEVGNALVWYGRKMCVARKHVCGCVLSDLYE